MSGAYRRVDGDRGATRWGTYSRISDDPHDTQRGVTRQQADTRAAVERLGQEVAAEYVENDTSAYRKRRVTRTDGRGQSYTAYRTVRPVWQQALTDLREGVITGLMVWDLDRLARDPRDLEDAIELVEHHGRIIAGESGSIDLSTDGGRAMARVLMAMNNKSSADTGRRVARAAHDSALRGTPAGKRAFGWSADKLTLHTVEADLARQGAADIIRGTATPWTVATAWNEAGAFTAHYGKPWRNTTVRQYLKNPRLAGLRTYRRELLRDEHGEPVRGQWAPLLDLTTWEQLQAALGSGTTGERYRVPHKGARHYLLTGLLVCGVCSGPMYGNREARRGTFYYRCTNVRHGHDKHTLTVGGPETDAVVTEMTTARLARLDPVAVSPTPFPDADELEKVERQQRELMAAYAADELPAAVVFPQVKGLEAQLARLRASASAWESAQTAPQVAELAKMFGSTDVGEQRTALERVYECVIVRPVDGSGVRGDFDPRRIEAVWRGQR